MKLLIAIPSARDWKVTFGSSLCGLIHNLCTNGIGGKHLAGFGMKSIQGGMCRARHNAVDEAINGGYTHLLFLDDDMCFPSDSVERLASHNLDIASANYARRHAGAIAPITLGLDGQPITSWGKTGIEEVGHIGLGLCLINIDSIKRLPKPLFAMPWDESRQAIWGEDMFFCCILRQNGVKIHIDHDLSLKVRHVGDFPYGFHADVTEINPKVSQNEEAA